VTIGGSRCCQIRAVRPLEHQQALHRLPSFSNQRQPDQYSLYRRSRKRRLYRTGFPFSAANNAGTIVGPVNAYRFPHYLSWNVDLERRLRFRGQTWALRVGFNNITDHFNPDSVNGTVESSQFLQFYGELRRALVMRIRWLGGR
jgi:hypothetical protein